jgi:ABC-type amino acid transport substrate-binding protein
MRRLSTFAVVALLVTLAQSAAASDLAAIKARGSLRVLAVQMKQADEFFQLQGRPGFDREILEGFAKLHGLRLVPVPVSGWDELVPALVAERGDVIAGRFTVTEERKHKIAFTRETFPTRNVVLTRAPTPPVKSLEELRSLRVGTIAGSSMAEAVARAGVPAASVDDGIKPGGLPAALVSGRVKAVVLGVESAITAKRDDPKIELGLFLGPPGSLAFGARKQDEALVGALDAYIENLRKTASWSRLAVKYFGESAPEVLKKARAE